VAETGRPENRRYAARAGTRRGGRLPAGLWEALAGADAGRPRRAPPEGSLGRGSARGRSSSAGRGSLRSAERPSRRSRWALAVILLIALVGYWLSRDVPERAVEIALETETTVASPSLSLDLICAPEPHGLRQRCRASPRPTAPTASWVDRADSRSAHEARLMEV
jgi:hypothetical protein